MVQSQDSFGRFKCQKKTRKKLVFYVDPECTFSTQDRCSYYSSEETQRQAGDNAKKVWGQSCPTVYLKTGRKGFTAFCPTKGGAWGEQLPALGGPGPNAVRVELQLEGDESWAEIIEKAAKTARKMGS